MAMCGQNISAVVGLEWSGSEHRLGLRRVRGALYAAFGVIFTLTTLICMVMGVQTIDDYHVPYACEALECIHGYERSPDGELYCKALPPREIKMASVSPASVRACQVTHALVSSLALVLSVSMVVVGLGWLCGKWGDDSDGHWYVTVAAWSPLTIVLCMLLCAGVMFPYGIVPM